MFESQELKIISDNLNLPAIPSLIILEELPGYDRCGDNLRYSLLHF